MSYCGARRSSGQSAANGAVTPATRVAVGPLDSTRRPATTASGHTSGDRPAAPGRDESLFTSRAPTGIGTARCLSRERRDDFDVEEKKHPES